MLDDPSQLPSVAPPPPAADAVAAVDPDATAVAPDASTADPDAAAAALTDDAAASPAADGAAVAGAAQPATAPTAQPAAAAQPTSPTPPASPPQPTKPEATAKAEPVAKPEAAAKPAKPEAKVAAKAEAKASEPAAEPAKPEAAAAKPEGDATDLYYSGKRKMEAGDLRGAIADLKTSQAIRFSVRTLTLLGRAYFDLGEFGPAAKALQQAGTYDEAMLLLAQLYQQQGKNAQARKVYERFLKEHPDHPKAAWVKRIVEAL